MRPRTGVSGSATADGGLAGAVPFTCEGLRGDGRRSGAGHLERDGAVEGREWRGGGCLDCFPRSNRFG